MLNEREVERKIEIWEKKKRNSEEFTDPAPSADAVLPLKLALSALPRC